MGWGEVGRGGLLPEHTPSILDGPYAAEASGSEWPSGAGPAGHCRITFQVIFADVVRLCMSRQLV